jgi:hypothetical protein
MENQLMSALLCKIAQKILEEAVCIFQIPRISNYAQKCGFFIPYIRILRLRPDKAAIHDRT